MAADPEQHASSSGRTDPGAAAGAFRVPFVGLTGGLGSGKSTACAALERLGAVTLSTDAVVHELYASDAVRDAVVFAGLVRAAGLRPTRVPLSRANHPVHPDRMNGLPPDPVAMRSGLGP